jgi:hypothetical protein
MILVTEIAVDILRTIFSHIDCGRIGVLHNDRRGSVGSRDD